MMTYAHPKTNRPRGAAWQLLVVAASSLAMASAAHATNYNEGPVTTGTFTYTAGAGQNGTCMGTLCTSYWTPNDLSNDGAHPTNIGILTPGDNYITGALTTYGPMLGVDAVDVNGEPIGLYGELVNQDMDYATFTVPSGDVISRFVVSDGTSIMTGLPTPVPGMTRDDNLFLGLASGKSITGIPYGSTANDATGLLGYTLVSQPQLGSDILAAIGSPTPKLGATGFAGPLGAGTYTLWLYDGDNRASYSFDAIVSGAPEPETWALMLAGLGLAGAAIRANRRRPTSAIA